MTTPEELDELLQVNSVKTWLLFAAICVVLAGMLLWGFLGVITHQTDGFGIIRIRELPREVVSHCNGQVDSVFCLTGDEVLPGQKLLTIHKMEDMTRQVIAAPFQGRLTGLNVREGSVLTTGLPLLEMARDLDSLDDTPVVIFFVKEQEIAKLKTGMKVAMEVVKAGIPPDMLRGTINFIADYPASRSAILKYFPGDERSLGLDRYEFHEVRASIDTGPAALTAPDRSLIRSLNGLTCRVKVTVSRQSPASFLFH